MQRQSVSDFDRPSYNIKAVAQMVGVLPVTLRAWERRYGFPSPSRGGQGYRLYSEHDLQTLRWLKSQLDSGVNIGQAAQQLHQMQQTGKDPVSDEHLRNGQSLSLADLSTRLLANLKQYNSQSAVDVLRQGLTLYGIEEVFSGLFDPIITQAEASGLEGIAFSTDQQYIIEFFHEQLLSLLAVTIKPFRAGAVIAGCMPGEFHQLSLLMLVIMLRMRGWNVIYLGANTTIDRMDELVRSLNPKLLVFSASVKASANQIHVITKLMDKIGNPSPAVALCGGGFEEVPPRSVLPFHVLTGHRLDLVIRLEKLIEQARA